MDERHELDKLHDHWHTLRNAVDVAGVTVAVIQERQKGQGAQMDRIEGALSTVTELVRAQNGRVSTAERHIAVLQDRAEQNSLGIVAAGTAAHAASAKGAKLGALLGAFVAALIAGLAALFRGTL